MSGYVHAIAVTGREWLNANDRGPWQRRARLSREWRESAAWFAKAADLPRCEQIRILAIVKVRDNRRRDPANYHPTAKAAVDGLVDAGVIPDDDARHVEGPDMRLMVDAGVRVPTLVLQVEVLA